MGYTENASEKVCKGLYVEQRKGAAVLKARASIKGKVRFESMATTDWDRAKRKALAWFARVQKDEQNPGAPVEHVSMHMAAKGMLADIRKPIRKSFHTRTWNAMSDFFVGTDVDAVDTPMLKRLITESRRKGNTESTVAKKVVTVRKALQFAAEHGWIPSLPVFPKLDRVEPNPQPWIDVEDYAHLLRVAEARVEEVAGNDRLYQQRQDLFDFIRFAVAAYPRVDELRNVRVRDCKVVTVTDKKMLAWFQEEARLNAKDEGARYPSDAYTAQPPTTEFLMMEVTGKKGTRVTRSRKALPIFQAIVKRKKLGPDDFLWAAKPGDDKPQHHREGFLQLLIAAKLRTKRISGVDRKRNLKSLRCTGLMMTVLEKKKTANYKAIAENAGTSLAMLEQFYLKPLNLHVDPEDVL